MQNIYTKNSILIFLAAKDFSEEEYLIVKNVFERSGKAIFIASDSNSACCGDNGQKVGIDVSLYNVNNKNFAAIVLIGGRGIEAYRDNNLLHRTLQSFKNSGEIVAAICKAPLVLAKAGLLTNISATCWREDKNELISLGIDYKDTNVVSEKNIITANGPRAAEQFAETILNMIK